MAEPEPQAPDGNGGSGMELATRAEQEQDSIVIVDTKYYQKLSESPPSPRRRPCSRPAPALVLYAPALVLYALPLFCACGRATPRGWRTSTPARGGHWRGGFCLVAPGALHPLLPQSYLLREQKLQRIRACVD